jgi:plastocyanin
MTVRFHAAKSLPALFGLAALLGACGTDENLMPGPNEILVGTAISFTPTHLTVPAGTTVRWRNVGPYDHTVTSGLSSKVADQPGTGFDDVFNSGTTFEFTFEELGDHPFFCRPHEFMGMKGVITVVAPTPPDAGVPDGGGT